jgi:hypothetical protein
VSFSVRMGINSGDVVVGRIGDDLRMDYTHHWEEAGRPLEAARWQTRTAMQLGANAGESLFHWRKVTELLAGENAVPEARALMGQARARLVYAAGRGCSTRR